MSTAPAPTASKRVGIIDIGSNSLRLVVYDKQQRAPVPLFNEKVMCQLGKGLASSGRLNPEGVERAFDAIRRYLAMAGNMGVSTLSVLATAAVRDAEDGKQFLSILKKEFGLDVQLISGEEEAQLGAYGVMSSIQTTEGLCADLGGGSIELVHFDNGTCLEQKTLSLGQLTLLDATGGDPQAMKKRIAKTAKEVEWLPQIQIQDFYAIGGSFRAIAKLHMHSTDYPLRVVHEYTVGAEDMLAFVKDLAGLSLKQLESLPGMSAKRLPAIIPASLWMAHIIKTCQPQRIIFSGSGIREGYLYRSLPAQAQQQDALIYACTSVSKRRDPDSHYAHELMEWMQPLLSEFETDSERRIRMAFCLLSDIAHHIYPEYRAEWARQRVIYSALTTITHTERLQLALALYHRYQPKDTDTSRETKLLNARQRQWSQLVGTAANLAYHLTGTVHGTLHHTSLVVKNDEVTIVFEDHAKDLEGEAISKRLQLLSSVWQQRRK